MSAQRKTAVTTARYVRDHGRQPRGDGYWAFAPSATESAYDADMMPQTFWQRGTYADAKRAAVEHFTTQGVSLVAVLA